MKTEMTEVKDFCKKTVCNGKKAYNTAKDIVICPKVDASLNIKSKNTDSDMFKCSFKCNKEITLLNVISVLLGFIAAFALASILIDSIFGSKKCKCKKDDVLDC